MNNLEGYLVELLQGRINVDGEAVPVVKQFSQSSNRPVLTLDLSPGVSTNHVYNDPGSNQVMYERHATVNINVWCDTEEQRAELTRKILYLFQLEQDYHYAYCTQYRANGEYCRHLGGKCKAVDTRNNRCPSPYLYEYQGLRERWSIIPGTLNVEPPFDLDDLSDHPPLLRSIIRCEAQYTMSLGECSPVESINLEGAEDGLADSLLVTGSFVDEWKSYFSDLLVEIESRLQQVHEVLPLEQLRELFAPLDHRHDELYSDVLHDHDSRYSRLNHNHDSVYSKVGHNHDAMYSSVSHNHDDRYSSLNHVHGEYATRADIAQLVGDGHVHDHVLYITPFRVRDGDLTYVLCELEPSEVMVLEDLGMEHFHVADQRGRYIFLEYDETIQAERTYHLLYYSVHEDGVQQDSFLHVNDVLANQGDTVDLYSSVVDENNAPVDEGRVDYDLDYGGVDVP
jgi:hypothetical protein